MSSAWYFQVVAVGRVPRALRRNRHRKVDDPIYTYFRELDDTCHKRRKKGLESIDPLEWERGVKMVLNRINQMTPFRMSNIINCFKRAKYVDEQFFEVLLGKAFRDSNLISEFDPMQISMTVQSLAMLARDVTEGEHEGASKSSFPNGDSGSFVASCLHFSKLLVQSAIDRDLLGNAEFSTRELSSLMHGLGLFTTSVNSYDTETVPPHMLQSLLQEFCKKSVKNTKGENKAQDYANVLHGCKNLGFKDPRVLRQLFASMRATFTKDDYALGSDDVGNICWALGEIGIQDDELLAVLVSHAKDAISWKPRSLSDVVCGLGLLGYHDEDLLAHYGRFVTVGHMVMSFTGRDLANTVFGFGLLNVNDSEAVLALAEEVSRLGRLASFTNQDLVRTIRGLGLLGFDQDRELWCLSVEVVKTDRLQSLRHEDLCDIFLGLGQSRFFKLKIHQVILTEIGNRMREMRVPDMVKTIEALVLLAPCGLEALQKDVAGLLREVADEIKFRGVDRLDSRTIAKLGLYFQKLGFRDKELLETGLERCTGVFNPDAEEAEKRIMVEDVSTVLVSCAHLNIRRLDNKVLDSASRIIVENLNAVIGVEQVSKCLASLAIFGKLDAHTLENFALKLTSLGIASKLYTFDVQIWCRILYSVILVTKAAGKLEVSNRVQTIVEQAKSQAGLKRPVYRDEAIYQIEGKLKDLGLKFTFGNSVIDNIVPVGFLVKGKPSWIVEIESLDEPELLLKNAKHNAGTGNALLRTKLLGAAGYQVSVMGANGC